ncbi:hypothetical protein DFH09DRAFT_1097856 [Mycena vulgaris]|nr:hypothetical protein DFH09DRAFT_1097856 [Mycena vulgaris]
MIISGTTERKKSPQESQVCRNFAANGNTALECSGAPDSMMASYGTIAEADFDGYAVPDADPLDEGVYYFVSEGVEGEPTRWLIPRCCLGLDALEHAVDPEAMRYSPVSEIRNKRDNFRTSVAERDVCCTFTNGDDESSHVIHIVSVS